MTDKLKIPSHPIVPIRMSGEDKAEAIAAANSAGYKSLGTWMKHLVREKIKEQEAGQDEPASGKTDNEQTD